MQGKDFFLQLTLLQSLMFKKQERLFDRYDSQRKYQLVGSISKYVTNKTSKNRYSQLRSSNKKSSNNLNSSEIYSEQQLTRPRRGVSAARNASKTKYAESMNKFRKQFVKNGYTNYEYADQSHRVTTGKQQMASKEKNVINIDDGIGVEELHYQMVKLHQNVKKIHQNI